MACDIITFTANQRVINERSTLTVTARFGNRSSQSTVTPTNVYWRLDSPDSYQIVDWTSVTPGTTVDITPTSTDNQIINSLRTRETKILTVASDYGLSTQYVERFQYEVRNQPWLQ